MSQWLRKAGVLIVFAVGSCDLQDAAEPESVVAMPQSKHKRPLPRVEMDQKLQTLADIARTDLLERLSSKQLDAEQVAVVQAERVTWRSAALGCPQPDRGYMMVLTPGVLIKLRVGKTTYEYHSTLAGPPFLCEPPGRIETPAPRNHSLDPT